MSRYIDAEKMQSLLEDEIEGCGYPISENNPIAYGTTLGLKMALSYAKTQPTADVAPVVHAHWATVRLNPMLERLECSNCGCPTPKKRAYCPDCGAKMDEFHREQ